MRHSKKDAVRLNKLISEAGFCSRREADLFIEQERVTVNSHTAKPGDRVYRTDFIKIDGEPLRFVEKAAPEKKEREFPSKRFSRNSDKPRAPKAESKEAKAKTSSTTPAGKSASSVKDKDVAKKALKSTSKPASKPTSKPASKPAAGDSDAKKWFSGRKKR